MLSLKSSNYGAISIKTEEVYLATIIDYLSDPLQAGVHLSQSMLDYSKLEDLFRYLDDLTGNKTDREMIGYANQVKETVGHLSVEFLEDLLEKAISVLVYSKECPREILEYLFGKKEAREFLDKSTLFASLTRRRYRWDEKIQGYRKNNLSLFEPQIFHDIEDTVVIERRTTPRRPDLFLEIISIKDVGTSRFINFLKSIPCMGETLKLIKNRKTHSSRYVFHPYPYAVQLWLKSERAENIPQDLKDFLKGSARYHSEREWRTSIVLSAIAVEVILADLYEEQFKETAPNTPLGDLYYKLKERRIFPEDVQKAIEIANEARISAVHRRRFPISDREADNALFGATKVTMWYSSNF